MRATPDSPDAAAEAYMRRALSLAGKAGGRTGPNPMVGAVVVKSGRVVGEGYHHKAGGPHAEVLALRQAGVRARGGTLYVTLEPCVHTLKRTPPCSEAILTAGIKTVVAAMRDPNPLVSGKGLARLRRAGLHIIEKVLEQQAQGLNRAYLKWVTTGRPYVILKAAMTLDGKIAAVSGESKWISGEKARALAHRWRSETDAVVAGIGTVLKDDPQLTARIRNGRHPHRVILDRRLRIPVNARALDPHPAVRRIVAAAPTADKQKRRSLEANGVEVWILPAHEGGLDLGSLLDRMGREEILSVMVEGGAEVNASFLHGGFVDELRLFISPKLLGGQESKGLIAGPAPKTLSEAMLVEDLWVRRVGEDILIQGRIK
jgi:diaminohydroxyphosphoribosylaminopyrimidine deaminase/5-amino-6-(5-phosphoribosylamino)uracil reductase